MDIIRSLITRLTLTTASVEMKIKTRQYDTYQREHATHDSWPWSHSPKTRSNTVSIIWFLLPVAYPPSLKHFSFCVCFKIHRLCLACTRYSNFLLLCFPYTTSVSFFGHNICCDVVMWVYVGFFLASRYSKPASEYSSSQRKWHIRGKLYSCSTIFNLQ